MKISKVLRNAPREIYQPDPNLGKNAADMLLSDDSFNQLMMELSDK